MGRPKKVVKPQGEQTTKSKAETTIVKVEKAKEEVRPLKKGNQFLFIVNGVDRYLTRVTANVMFKRNANVIEIPKGSEYIPPKGSSCDGC